jgi:AraC-like DNA-binding protein
MELMCHIFRTAQTPSPSHRALKLAPSIQYISENLTSDIDCKYLAKLCCLSTAQFYNLFQLEYQTTPLGYRNALIMQRATHLLGNEEYSVTEISEMLGFESVAYFSRFFKKHQGVSPSEYWKH